MIKSFIASALLLCPGAVLAAEPPLLLQDPALSATSIAFAHAGEIWSVPRTGGAARRLVSGQGRLGGPHFSPDGTLLTFTGNYDGNFDAYVVAAGGGEPRRLTHHPGTDVALGFTPDGRNVLISSELRLVRDLPALYTVPVTGGPATALPLPSGVEGSYAPDTRRIAYVPFPQWQPGWKQYRGGQTTPLWIADLSDSSVVRVPRQGSNDRNPIWVGETVYFLSDRAGPVTLFAYDTRQGSVTQVIDNPDGFDIKSASAGPGGIVYHQFGELRLYDTTTRRDLPVEVRIAADLPQLRPTFAKVPGAQILHAAVSPSGKRALFEARGEILSVPASKGDVRNLTRSPGVADRDAAWSPDGKWIAWLSDASGEYALQLRAPDGLGPVRTVELGGPPSFFYAPRWSPDSTRIALTDKRMNLWIVEVDKGGTTRIDADLFDTPFSHLDPAWSPDSRYLAYTRQLPNHLRAVFIYSLEDRKIRQVTDGRSDSISPRFDRNGKHLYFVSSTGTGLAQGWLDMTSMGRAAKSSVYAAVLRSDLPSPAAPESDEEEPGKPAAPKPAGDDRDTKDTAPPPVEPIRIDFDGLGERIVALPIESAAYTALRTGTEGILYLLRGPVALADQDYLDLEETPPLTVLRFDLATRKTETLLESIDGGEQSTGALETFLLSADGAKMLYAKGKAWFLTAADKAPPVGDGALGAELEVFVDPRAEWRQMYREVWRLERDFLYAPNFHGLDLRAAERTYEPFLERVASRGDLNTLFEEMTGHLVLGHTFVGGGAQPRQDQVSVGLLGADFRIVDGRYQVARVLRGEGFNPKIPAPLRQPGATVEDGEFILAIGGQELRGDDDIFRLLQGTAGKSTTLSVGPKASGSGARSVTVTPIASETSLRLRTWMEDNRRHVDEQTGGRVAYVYIPDTYAGGFSNFNRYYFSQVGKEAVILDERFNHGGAIADFIVDQLKRTPQMANASREGNDVVEPAAAIFGPKVMLINQMSGSGGDALPWLFRKAGLGPLIGVRTWGGLVGIGGYPSLIDGGQVTAPRWGIYGTEGAWEVENVGIGPDIEVEQDPALMRDGRDPQLDRAIAVILERLADSPPPILKRPPYPDYHQTMPRRRSD